MGVMIDVDNWLAMIIYNDISLLMRIIFTFLLQYPERVFQCEAGVTAMDFSNYNPNLLAVSVQQACVDILIWMYNLSAKRNQTVNIYNCDDTNSHNMTMLCLFIGIEKQKKTFMNGLNSSRTKCAMHHDKWWEEGVQKYGDKDHQMDYSHNCIFRI